MKLESASSFIFHAGDMLEVIGQQFPFEPLVWKPFRISFPEGIKLLKEAGAEVWKHSFDALTLHCP